ncbi:hypothetical protein [Candidatus Poriferisodalis sp.]|uniref:hypothetical protein n=1 Tax=Candidatus Poriferisodalis sp. TaxID=3101277 RepID=UPI003D0B2DA9
MTTSLTPAAAALRAVARWLGPPTEPRDARVTAGLLWYATLLVALRIGALAFGLLMTAIAVLGAWQAVVVRCRAHGAATPRAGSKSPAPLSEAHRLPACALAGAVALAGVFNTRLAGAVIAAAVGISFVVVGALRPGSGPSGTSAPPSGATPNVLARAGVLMRTWMHVGVAAACAAAVARYSLGSALVLVSAAAAYDAGAHANAAPRVWGLRGPLAGVIAAAAAIFALTGLSVPPFAPDDAARFVVVAALTLPLGPAIARPVTVAALRSPVGPADHAKAAPLADADRRWGHPLHTEWAVRRLDSLTLTALGWMWGLGIVTI